MTDPADRPNNEPADVAYLRPILQRLGADEVHRLVDLVAAEEVTDEHGP